ncbi:MAG: DNA methyltransferase [Flavobacteriales bacterium]
MKASKPKLEKFHQKLAELRFLDPACGCGNFLVITYRELRRLEMEVIRALQKGQQVMDVDHLVRLNVDRFYGIELDEFPAQIAQVAMWLTDHQLNQEVSAAFGEYMVRIPLRSSATIANDNALRRDWQSLLPVGKRYDYILGNPPFAGKKEQERSTEGCDWSRTFASGGGLWTLLQHGISRLLITFRSRVQQPVAHS